MRCSFTLASRPGPEAVTLSLYGARPRLLESGQLELAELFIAFGDTVVGNAADYGDAQRTARQLQAAADSRSIVDQAKGMLMQALRLHGRRGAAVAAAGLPGTQCQGGRPRQGGDRVRRDRQR